MKRPQYDKVCYLTEQHEEHVPLRNLNTGEIGLTFGCTQEGTTIQVRLENGELDSWVSEECVELADTIH